jgi:NADH-quinone oxidoreductase subunit J
MSLQVTHAIITAIFVVSVAAVAAGALIAALSTRVIRSVCGLALCCLGLAGLYYFLHSPFLALMEILIYIGAVCVTIIFAVMLAEPDEPRAEAHKSLLWGAVAALISAAIFWGLLRLSLQAKAVPAAAKVNDGSVQALGVSFLTTYSMAFELISLVLLVAILGALAIARTGRTKS